MTKLVLNDDKYFIFEDVVLELVQTLIRDRDVVDKIAVCTISKENELTNIFRSLKWFLLQRWRNQTRLFLYLE